MSSPVKKQPVQVNELMTQPPLVVARSASILEAAKVMQEHGAGSVIVGDQPPHASTAGIFTERDLLKAYASGAGEDAEVSQWMTPSVEFVDANVPPYKALEYLNNHTFRHLPVVEDDIVVGVISVRDLVKMASIQPAGLIEVPRGLERVIAAETSVGDVRGTEGFYHYRQYSAIDLAKKRSLEDIWHLLFVGHLPDKAESKAWAERVRAQREVPLEVWDILRTLVKGSRDFVPLETLRSAISVLCTLNHFQPWMDISDEELFEQAIRVCSVTPVLLSGIYRLAKGQEPVPSRDDLGFGANYMYTMHGEELDPQFADAVEKYQITTLDHGFNASTFTARVIASTASDLGSAVVGAIGSLAGPLHGGAPSRALDTLDAIGTPDRARPFIEAAVRNGDRIMGFGHRVYKTEDPRSAFLKQLAIQMGAKRMELAVQVEQTVIDVLAELKPGRALYTNVEFYAGVVLEHCGLPPEMFTPTFASSRVIGWCTHVLEQAHDNRIIRPSALYVGPPPPQPVPDAE